MNLEGRAKLLLDGSNTITHFIFSSKEQMEYYNRFPEFIGIDGTFSTNRELYHLYVINVVDGLRKAVPVCTGFLHSRSTDSIRQFVHWFSAFVGGGLRIKGIMMDDCRASSRACSVIFPQAHQYLCRFHIMKNIKQRCEGNPRAEELGWKMLRTRRVDHFERYKSEMQTEFPSLFTYFNTYLLNRCPRWSPAYAPRAVNYGHYTNNFVEAIHRVLKAYDLSGKLPLWTAIRRTRKACAMVLYERQAEVHNLSR